MSIDKTPSLNYFHNQVFLTTRNVVNFSFSVLKNDPTHKVVVRSLTKYWRGKLLRRWGQSIWLNLSINEGTKNNLYCQDVQINNWYITENYPVESPVATTSFVSDQLSSATSFKKYQTFSNQIIIFGTCCKGPFLNKKYRIFFLQINFSHE